MNNITPPHLENEPNLPLLTIKGRTTFPIVQGGMGVGISNWNLS